MARRRHRRLESQHLARSRTIEAAAKLAKCAVSTRYVFELDAAAAAGTPIANPLAAPMAASVVGRRHGEYREQLRYAAATSRRWSRKPGERSENRSVEHDD